MKVLIVEDSESIRKLLRMEFERRGCEVLEAADLAAALELLPRAEAVLCDGEFPKSETSRFQFEQWPDVWAAWRRHLGDGRTARRTFVVCSGSLDIVERARRMRIRACAKPSEVSEAVNYLLQSAPAAVEILGRSRTRRGFRRRGGFQTRPRGEQWR
jgi:CheY-like chemotaxis protein